MRSVLMRLDGIDHAILEELHFLSRGRGFCFPGRTYLAKKLELSVWTISRHTAKLVRLGLLAVRQCRRRRRNGTWDTGPNLYKVLKWGSAIVARILSLTGVRRSARISKPKEKEERFDLSRVKDERWKRELEHFARLGTDKKVGTSPP